MNTDQSQYPKHLILFDGDCSLCNASVRFIIDNDKRQIFRFASLQSKTGEEIQEYYRLQKNLSSIILVEHEVPYTESTAILRICRKLKGIWPMLYGLILLPARLRDKVYRWVASNRYLWFGKETACQMPTPELRKRILL